MLLRSLRRRLADSRIWVFVAVLGPGFITANADNDATGIFGYSQAGAEYRFAMLWVLVGSIIALGLAQEMCARMGAVTGKGLADLIREEYGVKVTMVAMLALLVANFTTTVAEFAGMLAAVQIYAGPNARFVVVPAAAIVVWLLVTRGTYQRVERVLLVASLVYLTYVASAILSRPPWGEVLRSTFIPDFSTVGPLRDYIFMVINVVGTTITPWGQFYIQSAVRDKGVQPEDYPKTRLDVIFGGLFINLVAFSIVVCCGATLYGRVEPGQLADAGEYAKALAPAAGAMATLLFAIGLFNASLFGAVTVPLSTAYAITEALGWESGLGRRLREAPLFIGVFTFLIVTGALVVILFPRHLTWLIILPNIVGGVLLPIVLVLMQLLVNNKRLMGEYANGPRHNIVTWAVAGLITVLALSLLVTQVFGRG